MPTVLVMKKINEARRSQIKTALLPSDVALHSWQHKRGIGLGESNQNR
jgi:hypothetical protein